MLRELGLAKIQDLDFTFSNCMTLLKFFINHFEWYMYDAFKPGIPPQGLQAMEGGRINVGI